MTIQQGDNVRIEIRKYYGRHNNSKFVMINGRVVAIGYEENAKSNHKTVIEIVRKRDIGDYSIKGDGCEIYLLYLIVLEIYKRQLYA